MRAICVEASDVTTLEVGSEYFVFENGPNHVYVSRFNNARAHIGCYRTKYFRVLEEDQTQRPEEPEIDRDKFYKASLSWREEGYSSKELKDYYLKPGKTHAHFYHDESFKEYCGCFPLKWFSDFKEVEYQESVAEDSEDEQELLPVNEWEQMSLF